MAILWMNFLMLIFTSMKFIDWISVAGSGSQ